jgi:hypothetical protein
MVWAIPALAYSGACIMSMNWRVAVYTVTSFLVVTLPAFAQPGASTAPPADQSSRSSQMSVADQQLIRKLEEAGYTQVREIKSTAEGIAAKATKDGKEVSLVADSSGKFRER